MEKITSYDDDLVDANFRDHFHQDMSVGELIICQGSIRDIN